MEETVHSSNLPAIDTKVELAEERKNVGQHLRIFVLVIAVLHLVLSSGLFLGWNALLLIYQGERIYSFLCPTMEATDSSIGVPCNEEDVYLLNLYSTTATIQFAIALPLGMIADRFGPRSMIIGQFLLLLTCGGLILYTPTRGGSFDYNFILLSLLFGIRHLITPNYFHFSNLFPQHFNFVSSIIATSVSLSGATFLCFYLLWVYLQISLKTILLYFSILQVFFFVFSLVQPSRRFNSGERIMFSMKQWKLMAYVDKEVDHSKKIPEIPSVYLGKPIPVPSYLGTILERQSSSLYLSSIEPTSSMLSKSLATGEEDCPSTVETVSSFTKKVHDGALVLTILPETQKKGVLNTVEPLEMDTSVTSMKETKPQTSIIRNTLWEPAEDGGIFTLFKYLLQLRFIFLANGNRSLANTYTYYFSFFVPFGFVGTLFMGRIGDKYGQFLAFAFFTIGNDGIFSAAFAICNKTSPKRWFATVAGIILMGGSISTLLSGRMVTLVISRQLSVTLVNVIFASVSFCWLAGSLVLFYCDRRRIQRDLVLFDKDSATSAGKLERSVNNVSSVEIPQGDTETANRENFDFCRCNRTTPYLPLIPHHTPYAHIHLPSKSYPMPLAYSLSFVFVSPPSCLSAEIEKGDTPSFPPLSF
ncbi:putative Protein FMP42 [Cardiosporidium cionae]|uniref:Uncharacterized protein n=1 Tax=Cardiosporidium cionae TaxID=476202 RepID=A0ABQ7J8N9_9APIC|nr:putative Protein FMP42 [Cardiosporidium cionae]|eukprot:KAF8820352.1 putative Protein FMP42 [Cardiosporidium cionae]